MNKHTPGPWIVEANTMPMRYSGLIVNSRPNGMDRSPIHIARPVEWGTETEANAALIAAAPELAEALRALVGECEDFIRAQGGDNTEAIDKARAALALAGIE